MDPIEQFLQDSYKKYKNRFLTPEELSNIKSTYGSDSKLLVTDVLKKFNKPYDDATVNKITSTYGLGTQTTTPVTQTSNVGGIDHGRVKNIIRELESDNNYGTINKAKEGEEPTTATGAFQHMWSDHGSQIFQVTGIASQEEYLKNPEAQEKYQDYLQPMYEKQLPKIRKISIEQGKDYSDEELMYIIHHSWTVRAERFLKGLDVPDKAGLEAAIKKSRDRGLTAPRNITNKLVQENIEFISVNGILPTRSGKEFISPVDKRMVDKLTGFMEDHDLVVTDTNDSKIHKSKAQQTGKSLDVNFDDRSINPNKIKAAILDGQKRGLRLVYEIRDKDVYNRFIEIRPDLKDHIKYIPEITDNHFSVYHADNYDVDANLLSSSKVIPKERLQEIKIIKSKIIGASRRAGKVSDIVDTSIGITGITNKVTRLFTEEEQYRKAAASMFASGQLNVKDFTNEELAEIYNAKAEIVDMEKQSKIAKKRVQDQLADKGILEGVGDFFAGSVVDQIFGIGSADKLDTKDGKININYKDRSLLGNDSKYLTPEEILNLTAHPEAADPKNPNDPKNKALRGIQKILVSGDSLEFDAKTKADTLRREFSATRLQSLEKEIIKVGGKDVLKTLSALDKKYKEGSITEQELQQLQDLQQKLENNGGLLSKHGEQVEQYNKANDAIKALKGKYGIVTKLRLRDQDYQNQADAYDKKLGFWGKKERSVSNVLSAFGNGVMDIPGAVVNYIGIGLEVVTGKDLGASDAAKARGRAKVNYITPTNRSRGILETTMNIDGYEVVFENNKATGVYNSEGYKEEGLIAETIAKKAQNKLDTSYGGKQSKLDWLDNTSFNFASLQQGVEDTAPQLAEIFLTGNFMKAGAGAVTANLAKTATSGSRVANVARVLSKPVESARGIESFALVPVFAKDMVDGAIADGAVTPSQIFGTATTKLGMEAVAESMFAGPIGKMLSGKGISKAVFSKGLSEKLNDVIKYYAAGKITSRDFMNHLGRASIEFVKDAGGEFVEEAFIEWTEGAVNEFLNHTLDTNYKEETASPKEILSAGLVGLGGGAAMGGPRALANILQYKSSIKDTYQNLLSDVVGQTSASLVRGETVANPEAFKEYLSQAVEDGQIDQKDADKYSAAIQSAANRTSFTNDIDVSTGTFKDLRDNRGLEARENFITLIRNVAFNKALTESLNVTNQFDKEIQSKKLQDYESILKELELNAHKVVYSSATPTIIGLRRGLNPSQMSELRNKHSDILDELNNTKLNAINKAKAVELKLNEAANVILRSKENISENEKAQLNVISEQINTLTEELEQTNTEEEAKVAVELNRATPEQVALQTEIQTKTVNEQFNNFITTDENGISRVEDHTGFQGFIESNPLARDLIEKKLNELQVTNFKLDTQNIKTQISKSASTKNLGLEGRYDGKDPRIKTIEEAQFTADFIEELKLSRNNLDQTDPNYATNLDVINNTIEEFEHLETENNTENSYERKYANPLFRDFVDKRTSQKAEPVEYIKPVEKVKSTITPEQQKADVSIGKIPNTNYEVKSDGVYFEGKKLNNPKNLSHKELITEDIKRRQEEELNKKNEQGYSLSMLIKDRKEALDRQNKSRDEAIAKGIKDLAPYNQGVGMVAAALNRYEKSVKEIITKYNAELDELESHLQQETLKQESAPTEPITANGYKALSIADNLLVSEHLQVGDPAFYELEGSNGTNGKPRIQMVVYYNPNNPKTKKFGQPTTNSKRIVIGQSSKDLVQRFADQIKAGKERVETKVTSITLNKSKKLTPDNKREISQEDIEAMKPYLYVIGKSFNSNENIVLLDKEKDGENFISVSDFISDLKSKNPNLTNFKEVEEILRKDNINGKVVFIKGDIILPLDTITNKEYAPNKKFIEDFLERLTLEATGTADWRIDIDGRILASAVKKRSDVKDYTNENSPNFRGRLIEYFASGPQHRAENPQELLYRIKYNEEKGKSEKIYLTKAQALEELLNIRVNIDHAELRAEKTPDGLIKVLSDSLRIPATPLSGFTDLYNVIKLKSDEDSNEAEGIQVEDQRIVTPEEKETKNNAPSEVPKAPKTIERKKRANLKFKVSDANYTGRVEKAVFYLKTRFEEIGVEVNDEILKNLVKGTLAEGSRVWGAFHNAMVTLSSMSGEKIGRHEAMHVVFKMFLNKKQQIDILNELWNRHKNDPKYKGKEEQFKREMHEFLTSDDFNTNKNFNEESVTVEFSSVDNTKINEKNNKQFQKLTAEEKAKTIEQVTREHRSITALKDLAAKLAYRIGGKVEFVNRTDVDWKGYNQGVTSVLNEAYMDESTAFHEVLAHPIIRAIKFKDDNVSVDKSKRFSDEYYDYFRQLQQEGKSVEEAEKLTNKKFYIKENTLYQNLLKELETGRGKEVLEQVKKDYKYKDKSIFRNVAGFLVKDDVTIEGVKGDFAIEKYMRENYPNAKQVSFGGIWHLENEYTLEEQQEEAIVQLVSLMAADKLDAKKDATLISKLKELWKQISDFVKSLLKQDGIKIDELPITTTLNDLAEIMAYGNNKIILPGYKVEYSTPLGNKYDTLEEVNNEIRGLADANVEVDLSGIKENIKPFESINHFTVSNYNFYKENGKWYEDSMGFPMSFEEEYVRKQYEKTSLKDFIEKNKEYEQSKEIIEQWKKENNIQYDPEEVYSRGQGFYSSIGAYSNLELDLLLKNLIQHIEDNKKASENSLIKDSDKIIFGHPGIGKTHLKESGRKDIIDFDSDYKSKINKQFNLPEGFKARNDFQKSNKEEYQEAVRKLWVEAKNDAKRTGKKLFASDMILLREFSNDFDKVITMSKETFVNRAKQRNDYTPGLEGTEGWKNNLDKEIGKIDKSKVHSTDKYLSDLLDSSNYGFTISAFTKPIDKRLKHIEGTGDRVRFVIYPKSEHIKWAAPTDVYSGSVWDAHEKVSKDKKSELLGVSFTKAPALRNINEVSPNLADIIDNLNHAHNEAGLELTLSNFEIEFDENIDYSTKQLINSINKILQQKRLQEIDDFINTLEKQC